MNVWKQLSILNQWWGKNTQTTFVHLETPYAGTIIAVKRPQSIASLINASRSPPSVTFLLASRVASCHVARYEYRCRGLRGRMRVRTAKVSGAYLGTLIKTFFFFCPAFLLFNEWLRCVSANPIQILGIKRGVDACAVHFFVFLQICR